MRFPAFSGAIWSGLAELVHLFLTMRLLYVFTSSLGGSTEQPDPPLDTPQSARLEENELEYFFRCWA